MIKTQLSRDALRCFSLIFNLDYLKKQLIIVLIRYTCIVFSGRSKRFKHLIIYLNKCNITILSDLFGLSGLILIVRLLGVESNSHVTYYLNFVISLGSYFRSIYLLTLIGQ